MEIFVNILSLLSLVFVSNLFANGASVASASAKPDELAGTWFQGGVTEAMAAAKAAKKPLLLYWGAVWCATSLRVRYFPNQGSRT